MSDALVTLRDGRRVSNASEEWRAECEARYVANMGGHGDRLKYLDSVQAVRGVEGRVALERAARTIFETDVAPRLRAAMGAQKDDDGRQDGINGA